MRSHVPLHPGLLCPHSSPPMLHCCVRSCTCGRAAARSRDRVCARQRSGEGPCWASKQEAGPRMRWLEFHFEKKSGAPPSLKL